jgi:hypothetical protein
MRYPPIKSGIGYEVWRWREDVAKWCRVSKYRTFEEAQKRRAEEAGGCARQLRRSLGDLEEGASMIDDVTRLTNEARQWLRDEVIRTMTDTYMTPDMSPEQRETVREERVRVQRERDEAAMGG